MDDDPRGNARRARRRAGARRPSIPSLLAIEQLEGRLRIAPTIIASSGETHTEEMAGNVRAAWEAAWFELYATTETGILGVHCSAHTGMHLFEDLTIVEVLDEHDRPVPHGRCGHKLLVTNLVNRAQPLIRYELSDMVTLADQPCPCGRPFGLLSAVEGRSDDILSLPATAGGQIAVHPLALRSPMAAVPGLKQYRILHDDRGLHVRAALRTSASPERATAMIGQGLRDKLTSLGATPPEVTVELVERIEGGRDSAGKYRIIEARAAADRPQPHRDAEAASPTDRQSRIDGR